MFDISEPHGEYVDFFIDFLCVAGIINIVYAKNIIDI